MRRVAFLVANDKFPEDPSIPSLRFPQNDANDLAEILGDKETCGFETRLHLNESSQSVLGAFEETSLELADKDTILFYYAGHGILRGKDLHLATMETMRARRGATSIEAKKVLEFLKESNASRRVLILDCCYSGAIGASDRGGDAEDALTALAHSSGICILTASTAIQNAKEREKEEQTDRKKGIGVFTKALIDCLREPLKEDISVDDLYGYAFGRLVGSSQTPKKLGEQVGLPIQIGNFKKKLARLAEQQRAQLISTAREKMRPYVDTGDLTEEEVEYVVHLLERDDTRLFPHERPFRENVIRFLNGNVRFASVFAGVPQINEHDPLMRKFDEHKPHAPIEKFPLPTTTFPYLRLVGAWKGSLNWRKQPEVDFQVTLVIAECYNSLRGLLYYEGIYRNELLYKGADKLQEDAHIEVDREGNILTLKFLRKVHEEKPKKKVNEKKKPNVEGGDQLQSLPVFREDPRSYHLKCVFSKPAARECMNVEMRRLPTTSKTRADVWVGDVFKR